jgi:uncharacterized membrane protein YidH (DUF202 family)
VRHFLFDFTQILISNNFEKEIVLESSVLAWIRSRIELKCWIQIEYIRIHTPGLKLGTRTLSRKSGFLIGRILVISMQNTLFVSIMATSKYIKESPNISIRFRIQQNVWVLCIALRRYAIPVPVFTR